MTASFAKLLLQMKNRSSSPILIKIINGWTYANRSNQFQKENGSQKGTIVRLVVLVLGKCDTP